MFEYLLLHETYNYNLSKSSSYHTIAYKYYSEKHKSKKNHFFQIVKIAIS